VTAITNGGSRCSPPAAGQIAEKLKTLRKNNLDVDELFRAAHSRVLMPPPRSARPRVSQGGSDECNPRDRRHLVPRERASEEPPKVDAPERAPEPRFLNAGLWREASGTELQRLDAKECVENGAIYQLGVQIGPRDTLLETIGATAILEEVIRSMPGGAWVAEALRGNVRNAARRTSRQRRTRRPGGTGGRYGVHLGGKRCERSSRLLRVLRQQVLVEADRTSAPTNAGGDHPDEPVAGHVGGLVPGTAAVQSWT
jgi:hypothetical protein